MSKICYVCKKETPRAYFLFGLQSKHSQRTFVEIIDEILACFISHRNIESAKNCICMICFASIEDYEFHCTLVESRKQKLRQMLIETKNETEPTLNLFNNETVSQKRTYKTMNTNAIETAEVTADISNRLPDKIIRLSGSNKKFLLFKMASKETAPSKPVSLTPTISVPEVEESIHSEIKVEEAEIESRNSNETPESETENLNTHELNQPEPMASDKMQLLNIPQKKSCYQYKKAELNDRTRQTPVISFNGNKKLGFQCDICDRKFAERKTMKRHQNWHQKYKGWRCFTCFFVLPDKESLLNHEKLHVGRSAVECVICEKSFKTENILKNHIDVHGKKEKLCDFCGKAFNSRRGLDLHRTNVHIKTWHGECESCGFTTFSKRTLVLHLRNHLNVRPYTCSHCGYAFKRSDTLKTHERRHIEDTKKLKCTMCSARFEHKFYLNHHMQKKHQTENLAQIPFSQTNSSDQE